MTTFWVTAYILAWPVVTLGVLLLLCVALVRDALQARRDGSEMV